MGTTIGINTMIILAACFYFIKPSFISNKVLKFNSLIFWIAQYTLLFFLISLVAMGIKKALWQAGLDHYNTFSEMMN
ncbi:MAG: hypothetical protein R2790_08815 [Flavobacterium haoranii]